MVQLAQDVPEQPLSTVQPSIVAETSVQLSTETSSIRLPQQHQATTLKTFKSILSIDVSPDADSIISTEEKSIKDFKDKSTEQEQAINSSRASDEIFRTNPQPENVLQNKTIAAVYRAIERLKAPGDDLLFFISS